MTQADQHFKLLMYMTKPKPWCTVDDSDENRISRYEKARNVDRICRRLVISRAPLILLNCCTSRINKKKCYKRKAEPPFLIRNCISGHESWRSYRQKVQDWTQKMEQRKQNDLSISSSMLDQSQISYNDNQLENVLTSTAVPATSAVLLRSFYTIWHIGRISRKSLKTSEETKTALKELSISPAVEKCLRIVPKGGITAEVITDKSQLSKRALHTLSRWARMTEDVVQDGYESGYDEDPVEIWNRAIILADASCTESELSDASKTTADITSFSTSTDKLPPRRRRSNRLLKSVNLEL
uniref:TFIIS N-terminal domain-containing protein n=1 Tax=Elaeophora elaphi TaxID=1147741 RepID=A0A0R3RP89_9BILA